LDSILSTVEDCIVKDTVAIRVKIGFWKRSIDSYPRFGYLCVFGNFDKASQFILCCLIFFIFLFLVTMLTKEKREKRKKGN